MGVSYVQSVVATPNRPQQMPLKFHSKVSENLAALSYISVTYNTYTYDYSTSDVVHVTQRKDKDSNNKLQAVWFQA